MGSGTFSGSSDFPQVPRSPDPLFFWAAHFQPQWASNHDVSFKFSRHRAYNQWFKHHELVPYSLVFSRRVPLSQRPCPSVSEVCGPRPIILISHKHTLVFFFIVSTASRVQVPVSAAPCPNCTTPWPPLGEFYCALTRAPCTTHGVHIM
jgi:hypothetical protein